MYCKKKGYSRAPGIGQWCQDKRGGTGISGTNGVRRGGLRHRMMGQGGAWEASDGGGTCVTAAAPEASCCSSPGSGRCSPRRAFLPLSPHRPHQDVPAIPNSNVTGENLDLLKMFLNLLSPRTSYREEGACRSFRLMTPTPSRCVHFSELKPGLGH